MVSALWGTHLEKAGDLHLVHLKLLNISLLHTPMTMALAGPYNPLEGPICGLFMTAIVTATRKTSCTPHVEPILS